MRGWMGEGQGGDSVGEDEEKREGDMGKRR